MSPRCACDDLTDSEKNTATAFKQLQLLRSPNVDAAVAHQNWCGDCMCATSVLWTTCLAFDLAFSQVAVQRCSTAAFGTG